MNVFTTNVVISDLLSATLHSLAVHSARRGRWSFGQLGTRLLTTFRANGWETFHNYLNLTIFF